MVWTLSRDVVTSISLIVAVSRRFVDAIYLDRAQDVSFVDFLQTADAPRRCIIIFCRAACNVDTPVDFVVCFLPVYR